MEMYLRWLYEHECRDPQGSEILDPMKLELQRVVHFPVWALGTALGLAARAALDRNH